MHFPSSEDRITFSLIALQASLLENEDDNMLETFKAADNKGKSLLSLLVNCKSKDAYNYYYGNVCVVIIITSLVLPVMEVFISFGFYVKLHVIFVKVKKYIESRYMMIMSLIIFLGFPDEVAYYKHNG